MSARKSYSVKRPLRRPPTHPGELLREIVLPELRMSVTQAAEELGVSRQSLHEVLAERRGVTPEMAVRLGKWCGNGPELWLSMQEAVDLHVAKKKLKEELKKVPSRAVA